MLRCERAFPIFHFHWKHIWPYPSRVQPETCRLGQLPSACKSLNFWHFFKLRDIVLLPACVCERESERGVEGAVSAMRGVLPPWRPFPFSYNTHTHTHTRLPSSSAMLPQLSARDPDSLLDLWLPNISRIPLPPHPFSTNRSTSSWIFHCQNLISCFLILFHFVFFHFFLRSPSILFFGFQFRPS